MVGTDCNNLILKSTSAYYFKSEGCLTLANTVAVLWCRLKSFLPLLLFWVRTESSVHDLCFWQFCCILLQSQIVSGTQIVFSLAPVFTRVTSGSKSIFFSEKMHSRQSNFLLMFLHLCPGHNNYFFHYSILSTPQNCLQGISLILSKNI